MNRVFVAGVGAVSPAGWNVAALRDALDKGEPLPAQTLTRPGWEKPLRARLAPSPSVRPDFLAHPRLRRTSPITHYAAAAALEAVRGLSSNAKTLRFGIVVCLQSGCVQYSCRFYDETLQNPMTASPLVFPETVYAAPSSHVAALLENVALASSLVGDASVLAQGICLGAQWLQENQVDACLVIGTEEAHWITADALRHLDRHAIVAAGAGALCLSCEPNPSSVVELAAVTDSYTYSARCNRMQAAAAMRGQLGESVPTELLCGGFGNNPRTDAAECAAWRDWDGPRLRVKHVLGEGLMATAAWQCVAACDAVANGRFTAANVSLVGSNQQAVGLRFTRISHLSPTPP